MMDWDRWPNFSRDEFECHCGCGRADMEASFMDVLQEVRTAAKFPFFITSGFRCPAHNASIGGGPEHVLGKAADIHVYFGHAWTLNAAAARLGVPRIGWRQKGPIDKRFIHLGTAGPDEAPSPRVWSY
jgi:hypothetical protein